jgi:hypothetical protein
VGAVLFGAYEARDLRIQATMKSARDRLWCQTPVGGMARYTNDDLTGFGHVHRDKIPQPVLPRCFCYNRPVKKNPIYAVLLLLNAAAFAFFGVKWLLSPVAMAGGLGIQLTNADAITDAQAVYGGLELGVGIFLALCARRATLYQIGLLAATLALSGLGLCRGLGILLAAQHVTGATWQLLGTDLTGAVLNGVALFFVSRQPSAEQSPAK